MHLFFHHRFLAAIIMIIFVITSFLGTLSQSNAQSINCGVITIPVGTRPNHSLLVGTDLYISNNGSNQVSVVDTTNLNTDTVASNITVGTTPIHASYSNGKLYVVNRGSATVSVLDVANNNALITTLPIGNGAYFSILVGTKLYVLNTGSHNVTAIDTTTDTVITTITGFGLGPYSAVRVGTKVYVNNLSAENSIGKVSVIDTTTDTVTDTINVAGAPYGSSLFGTKLYVYGAFADEITVVDTTTNTVMTSIPAPNVDPYSGTVVGNELYVNNIAVGTVSVFNTLNDTLITTITVGRGPISSTLVNGKLYVNNSQDDSLSVIDTATHTVVDTITVGNSPYASTLSGSNLYVSNAGSNTISVVDVVDGDTFICGTVHNYTLTYTAGAHGSITGSTPQTVSYGNNGSAVTAVPAPGYLFDEWSDNSTENPRTDTNITANLSVTASFVAATPGNTAPVITLNGSSSMSILVGDTFTDPGAIVDDEQDGNNIPVTDISGSVDTLTPGVYTLTYNFTDSGSLPATPATRTVTVSVTPPSEDNGGGGGGGGGGNKDQKDIAPNCSNSFTSYIKRGWNNNPTQVTLWQKFFNKFFGSNLPETGVYDDPTFNETKEFQLRFSPEILSPWGLDHATGFIYKTTRMKANQLIDCAETTPVVLDGTGKTFLLPPLAK